MVSTNADGKIMLVGIVSQGFGCGNDEYPGLYVPIFKQRYLEWIKKTAF